MKQRMINQEHIEGYLYEHDLVLKTVQNEKSANYGKEFISGNLYIATDEVGMNVIPVHFTYVTAITARGGNNATFSVLRDIIENGKTWIKDGKDNAMMLKVDTRLGLNDFYNQNNELVSVKRNESGFVNIVNNLCDASNRNNFTMDMVIMKTVSVEPEDGSEPYMTLEGAVFDFRNALLPVSFVVRNPAGIKYFADACITNSEPMFTKVWGKITSTTSTVRTTEESAFGEVMVKTYENKIKEWTVTGAERVPYDFGDPMVLDSDQLLKAQQERSLYLASVKKKAEDYKAEKEAKAIANATLPFDAMPAPSTATFNF